MRVETDLDSGFRRPDAAATFEEPPDIHATHPLPEMEPPDDLNLAEPERRMWDAVMSGQPCIFGDDDPRQLASADEWGPERTVRGHVLAALLICIGASRAPKIRQVQIQGARVIGEVGLSHAEMAVSVRIVKCFFGNNIKLWLARTRTLQFETCVLASLDATGTCVEGFLEIVQSRVQRTVSIRDARISHSVVLSGSRIAGDGRQALDADGLKAGGSVQLSQLPSDSDALQATGEGLQPMAKPGQPGDAGGFHASGEVRLIGASITGQLNCTGGRFNNPTGVALTADSAEIGGHVHLGIVPDSSHRFHAIGQVSLVSVRIGGQLNCTGGRFDNPCGEALKADGADIRGSVNLCASFHATGVVWLVGVQIGTVLNCAGGRFENSSKMALVADSAEIGGSVFLHDGFRASGQVWLLGARITGQLNCSGGRFDNPENIALAAENTEIGGGVLLRDGFHASGEVKLSSARICGQLSCSGGRFENPQATILNLQEVHAHSLWLRDIEIGTAGQINLHGTKVSLLADDPVALASQGITLHLDGFVYERIAPNSPQDVSTRLQWLERQRLGYHPQPFDQLAAVFQRSGRDHEATRVLIEKRRKRRETLQGWWRKFGDALLDLSVLYGWQAWRPLAAGFAIFLLVFGLVLAAQAVGLIVSLSDVASPYNPFIHALDVFLPIVDLGVESRWTIDTANGGAFAWLVMAFLWTLKLVGWGVVTLALAALTGIVKRD